MVGGLGVRAGEWAAPSAGRGFGKGQDCRDRNLSCVSLWGRFPREDKQTELLTGRMGLSE